MSKQKTQKQKITELIGLANLSGAPNSALNDVSPILLHCPHCSVTKNGTTLSEINTLGVWESRYLVISCEQCTTEWCLCMECGTKQRTRIQTLKQAKDHTSNNHSSRKRRASQVQYEEAQSELEQASGQIMHNPTHGDDTIIQMPDEVEDIDVQHGDETIQEQDSDDEAAEWVEVVNSNNLGFTSRKNSTYFEQCFLGTNGDAGIEYLVMRSARRTELEATEYASERLPPGHADLQTRIAKLTFTLTRGQSENLVKVLQGAYQVGCENGFACSQSKLLKDIDEMLLNNSITNKAAEKIEQILKSNFSLDLIDRAAHTWSTRIPSSWNDVRQLYLEGARSIVQNLPTPTIKKDIAGHSYVSIIECIRHFLAHRDLSCFAIIPNQLQETEVNEVVHTSLSNRAKEIIQQLNNTTEKRLTSYVIFWSDDVEPNRMKANRGSVWLLTATIGTHLNNGHSMENTFPIAVGRKGENHDPVIQKVEEEMSELRSGSCPPFYVGKEKRKVNMAFEMLCMLQDQPERRDFNSMRAGNGQTTGRFGVSADHYALYNNNTLPACRECLERMEQALRDDDFHWPMPPCNVCVRWDVLDDPNNLAYWAAPKDYPDNPRIFNRQFGDGQTYRCIRPFRISYDSLRNAVDTAHRGYVDEGWSNQNCESYLEVEGMSTKYINIVMEHCARSYSHRIALENPLEHQGILNAAHSNPTKYGRAPYPTPWTRPTVALELHPDVIMHLIFLGVVKTAVTQIQNCLSAQSKLASFLKSTEGYLKEFQSMSIEWIPIQPYQAGKMGGWVSENYLGFSRILPWFFQNIDDAVEMTTDFSPPEGLPQKKWLHRHNKYWLQVRGLSTKGNREELKERVAQTIAAGAPDPLPAPEIPTASIEAVLLSLIEILQCVMSLRVTPALINRTRYAVRVFLSKYDSLCRPLRQKTPAVLSSYNFICLLNLPDVMQRFGPLRHIWEGGPRGEGFVKFAKPLMTQGLRQNWQHQLLQQLHRAISFNSILPQEKKENIGVNEKDSLRAAKGMFHLYKSAFDVGQLFSRNRDIDERNPVSVVLVERPTGVTIVAVVRSYQEVLEIELISLDSLERFGLHYYCFDIHATRSDGIDWMVMARDVTRLGFGLLLPLLKEDDADNRFALISSNWNSLSPASSLAKLLE